MPAELELSQTAVATSYTREQVLEAIYRVEYAKQLVKEAHAALWESLFEWIEENGEIQDESRRWYITEKKKTAKPKDLEAAVDAVLTEVGGDLTEFVKYLSVNALKPGSAKKLLRDRFGELFEQEVVMDVATGKPKREVKQIDERYVSR